MCIVMRCGLINWEKGRTMGDLIEEYKIMTGKEAISVHKLFEIRIENRGIGHWCNRCKKQSGTLRIRYFSARVVNPWTELDEKAIAVKMVEKFKRKLSGFGY